MFAVEPVAPGIGIIRGRDHPRTANCYVLGDREILLVEPCVMSHAEGAEWVNRFAVWTREGRRIRGIAFTHEHADHSAGCDVLAATFGIPFYAPGSAVPGMVILDVPGHAPDHVALLTQDGVLVCGDMISTLGPVIIPRVGGDLAAYRRSCARLAKLSLAIALPGHGEPIADPTQRFIDASRA